MGGREGEGLAGAAVRGLAARVIAGRGLGWWGITTSVSRLSSIVASSRGLMGHDEVGDSCGECEFQSTRGIPQQLVCCRFASAMSRDQKLDSSSAESRYL